MQLRYSPASPFVRKVVIAAHLLGLQDRIDLVPADTLNPADPLRQQNPLGKIPALVLDDGKVLYDSRVIVEYLDHIGGGGVMPEGSERFDGLCLHALADGIMEGALLQVYETRFREEDRREPRWVSHQAEKIERALAMLEAAPPEFGSKPHAGHIGLACALGYLDLRFGGAWRATHPRLVAWLDDFAAKVPAFDATRPPA
jgi:glutathione S-transferase